MLILTRRKGEEIIINNDIRIIYIGDSIEYPNEIRIGIEAPSYVDVYRAEVKRHVDLFGKFRNK